ncbi:helix-turn-helix transcriptional regulator [Clostridium perfringens]|uniref:helix-turn-helix domain-containing protein n=1 Tax=Clostridium perfringens TaxID=1502 RepID=UPI00189B29C9|nr:helix-turn-helix transcriptional regulator [Clostridium perfringens]MBI6007243.1 helix-turn-helix transcriptional regulator [Clostridium perfringens]MBI6018865.1 helix-turn-helix transcriptional regulator [Clostridium perfringens]MDK0529850.1 helix-turn-helix transcriptional regulator [Clostridium perfringens]MDK0747995.1 helix-turn-helix transcriptional regulator [Clostridium perfringens]MDK0893280.1 helix-turn-helix transcriptional regulator [Clostridium perfringens]
MKERYFKENLEDKKSYIYKNRKIIGENVKKIIGQNGYTKSSFCNLSGISRPTLDKVINGSIDSSTTLKTHICKILNVLDLSLEDLINFNSEVYEKDNFKIAASNSAPKDYEMSSEAKEVFEIIYDLVSLCEIYK